MAFAPTSFGPVDVVLPHLAVERSRLDAEGCGSAVRAIDSATAALDGVENRTSLQIGQARGRRIKCRRRMQPCWIDIQGVAGAYDHCPLDEILQLANVSRP